MTTRLLLLILLVLASGCEKVNCESYGGSTKVVTSETSSKEERIFVAEFCVQLQKRFGGAANDNANQ